MSTMMPPQGGVPPQLAALLGGGGPPDGGDSDSPPSPLAVLQECIQSLPGVIQSLPDPKDTQEAVKALLILTGIQSRLMQGNGSQAQGG